MKTNRRATSWAIAIATLTLAACSSAPTRYYSLQPNSNPDPTSPRISYHGPSVQISSVHVPAELDRDELLREVGPGQFEVREQDHWSAPLGQMARQVLSEDLATRLPKGSLIYPEAPRPLGAANLSVDILSFRSDGSSALMQVSWSTRLPPPLSPSTPQAPPASVTTSSSQAEPQPVLSACTAQLQLRTPGSAADASATAEALSTLLGQLADHIAERLSAGCR